MDRSFSMHGRNEKCIHFWLEDLKEREPFGDTGVDGKLILEKGLERVFNRAFVNIVS
jgi:hypothetical protein